MASASRRGHRRLRAHIMRHSGPERPPSGFSVSSGDIRRPDRIDFSRFYLNFRPYFLHLKLRIEEWKSSIFRCLTPPGYGILCSLKCNVTTELTLFIAGSSPTVTRFEQKIRFLSYNEGDRVGFLMFLVRSTLSDGAGFNSNPDGPRDPNRRADDRIEKPDITSATPIGQL